MTKKTRIIIAAVLAVAAASIGGVAIASSLGTDKIGELDTELVGGDTLVVTVDGHKDDPLRFTYDGTTQRAAADPGDEDDGDERDYVARFPAAAADRTAGKQITVEVAASDETKTLTDRLEVDDDGDEDAQAFSTVAPVPSDANATATPDADGAGAAAAPTVRDLDADLVRGDTLVLTVEARDAETVKLRYGATTKTATPDRNDDGDRDRDYVARFSAAPGDRTDNARVSAKATATSGSQTATADLEDRVDVDD